MKMNVEVKKMKVEVKKMKKVDDVDVISSGFS